MSFIEARLDDQVAYGFQVIPEYDTLIVPMESGKEARNIRRTRAKRHFSAMYNRFSRADFALLLAAFHAAKGSGHSFRFKDWSDFEGTLEPLGNTPGANSTPVQLIKTYSLGGNTTVRTITKPVAGTVTVYQADGAGGFVAKPGTIDTTTGLFTPSTNWTAGRALKGTFEFDVAVRFSSDQMPSSYDRIEGISTTAELEEDFL